MEHIMPNTSVSGIDLAFHKSADLVDTGIRHYNLYVIIYGFLIRKKASSISSECGLRLVQWHHGCMDK